MSTLLLVVHFLVCIAIVILVMLQADKSRGLSGAFGGGESHTVFGYRESNTLLTKLTTIFGAIFLATSIIIYVTNAKKLTRVAPAKITPPASSIPAGTLPNAK